MASVIINRLSLALQKFEQILFNGFGGPPTPALAYANHEPATIPRSVQEFLKDHILWAAPKKRRSIERRMKRRYGYPDYVWKPHVPIKNMLSCITCGHDYIAEHLCSFCYETNKIVTEKLQNRIQQALKLDPVEKDVIVLFENDERPGADVYGKNQIVEIPEPRPEWFSRNLLQPAAVETVSKETKVALEAPFKTVKVENE